MVLEAFGVGLGGFFADPQGAQEIDDDAVAARGVLSQGFARGREENGAVGLGADQFLTLEAADGAGDGDVGNA